MKILVDTQVFLWSITGDPRLSTVQREYYVDSQSELYLSIASFWEIVIKSGLGKLPIPKPAAGYVPVQMELNRIETLPIRAAHLAQLERLPPLHRDPFDRMLAAQALAEGTPMLTADPMMKEYGVICL